MNIIMRFIGILFWIESNNIRLKYFIREFLRNKFKRLLRKNEQKLLKRFLRFSQSIIILNFLVQIEFLFSKQLNIFEKRGVLIRIVEVPTRNTFSIIFEHKINTIKIIITDSVNELL